MNPKRATLTFLGATDSVTGSRTLLEVDGKRVLVDCGLFQGWKKLRLRNWDALPFDPASLDAVILTHAHIDHSGYLPRLCQMGYAGPVHCTRGSRDLLRILLPDAGYLEEEDARRANKYGYTRHRPAVPLFTRADAEASLEHLRTQAYHESFEPVPGVSARFSRAGHIIGSACLELRFAGTSVAFSGDVGRPSDPIMRAPERLPNADSLVIESTYGDRRHPEGDVKDELARIVQETVARQGAVIVPAFAVGRAQHLLHLLAELKTERRIPDLPVHLDSPMAINATELFRQHDEDHRLSEKACALMCDTAQYSHTKEDSKAIDRSSGPMVVVSASGMATGGRILHHLRRFLPDPRNTILFVGYQSGGTRGRALLDGTDELKLHGQYIKVRARIELLNGLSAHADYRELLDWLAASELSPRRVFVNHGEPSAADAFRRRLEERFGWDVRLPESGQRFELA